MSLHSLPTQDGRPPLGANTEFMTIYLDALTLVERLHRLLLDVIKDEFERGSGVAFVQYWGQRSDRWRVEKPWILSRQQCQLQPKKIG